MYVYNVSFAILTDSSLNGEQACENHEYTQSECYSIGCCDWDQGYNQCWSAVGSASCPMVRTLCVFSHIPCLTPSLNPSLSPCLVPTLYLSLSRFLCIFVACVFFFFLLAIQPRPSNVIQLQIPLFLSSFFF